jgi:dolichol-phosphate mannosyltransferase
MSALVVMPTYNEAVNIPTILPRIRAAAPDADVLVVDDASPDGTAEAAARLGAELGGVHVLRRSAKTGLGDAYRAGFSWGLDRGYAALAQIDADLSHDPAVLPALFAAVAEGAELAIGSRWVPGGRVVGWPVSRQVLSRGGNQYARLLLGLRTRDATAGFRVYPASTLHAIDYATVRSDGYGFQVEMTYRVERRSGRIVEVPISFIERAEGTSKMSRAIVLEAVLLCLRLAVTDRWRRPTR